jgi:hypothetical protein
VGSTQVSLTVKNMTFLLLLAMLSGYDRRDNDIVTHVS